MVGSWLVYDFMVVGGWLNDSWCIDGGFAAGWRWYMAMVSGSIGYRARAVVQVPDVVQQGYGSKLAYGASLVHQFPGAQFPQLKGGLPSG